MATVASRTPRIATRNIVVARGRKSGVWDGGVSGDLSSEFDTRESALSSKITKVAQCLEPTEVRRPAPSGVPRARPCRIIRMVGMGVPAVRSDERAGLRGLRRLRSPARERRDQREDKRPCAPAQGLEFGGD